MLKIDKLQLEVVINGDPARLKLQELQTQATAVTKSMKGIKDQELLGQKKAELAGLQSQMEDIRKEIGLDGLSMNELGQRSKELQMILNKLSPNTPEFKAYQSELKNVKDRQAELRGSTESTGKSFKDQFTGLIEQMGLGNTRAGQFAKTTIDGMGQGAEKVKGFSSAFSTIKTAIAATGIGILLILIGSLFAWFEKTTEGSKALKMAMAGIGAVVDVIVGLFAKVGGLIADAFSHPVDSIKKLWQAIKENIVNRIEAVGLLFKSIGKIISSGFTDGYKDLGNAAIQVTTGIANGIEKMGKAAEFAKAKMKEMADAAAAAAKIAEQEINLAKTKRQSLIDEAAIERQIAKYRFDAADKTKEKEDRVKSLMKALEGENRLQDEQNMIESTNNKILHEKYDLKTKAGVKASTEEKDAMAESDAKMIRIETDRLNRTRKMNTQLQALKQQMLDEDLKEVETNFAKQEALAKQSLAKGEITEKQYNDKLIQLNIDQLNAKNKALEAFKAKYQKDGIDMTDIDKQIAENSSKIEDENLKRRKQIFEDLLKANQQNGKDILNTRKIQYESDLADAGNNAALKKAIEEKYKEDVLTIELANLLSQEQVLKANGEKTVDIEQQIEDKKAQIREYGYQLEQQQEKDRVAARKEYNLISLAEQEKTEIDALKAKYEQELVTDKEYAQASLNIKLKYAEQYIQKYSQLLTSMSSIVTGLQDVEITKNTTKYQKQLEDLEDSHNKGLISDTVYNTKKTALEKKQSDEEKNIKKKYADSNFAIQVAQIIASTSLAAIQAYASLSGIPIVGPILGGIAAAAAVVYGGVQIAQAKAQRDQVKSLNVGGFTDSDSSDMEPKGVVHANEFVANADAVRNPKVKSILNVIDDAQRRGTVRSLNLPAILASQQVNRGFVSGGYTSSITGKESASNSQNNDHVIQTMAAMATVINRLNDHLDKGIKANADINMHELKTIKEPQWDAMMKDVTKS